MMNRRSRRILVRSALAFAIAMGGTAVGRLWYVNRPGYGLPYSAGFMPDNDRWNALGGTWEVAGGTMRNDSNDRGAKILTGSAKWKNYAIEGDIQLLGPGSVGLLARVSEAELGENSFKGYFAGIRGVDNSLVLGAYDFAYHEAARTMLPEPVVPFRWYHVRLEATGCRIVAFASAPGMTKVQTAPVTDADCFRSGMIGLRSNGSGGVWRNVRVEAVEPPARKPGIGTTAAAPLILSPLPRTRPAGTRQTSGEEPPAQAIYSLRFMPPYGSPVASVRGSVILTRPAVYVEDATGGVEVQADSTMPLKIGDEVEVTGEVNLDHFSPVMRKTRVRLLMESVPLSPAVLTANQLAQTQYDDRFVQIEAYVRGISNAEDGQTIMDLEAGSQFFHAILPRGRSWPHLRDIAPLSRVHVRGVSVVDRRFNRSFDPFVMLVPSAEDVEVVAGPPWWRTSNLILTSLVVLGLIFTFNHLYLLVKHWRLRAVAEERERLAHEIHDTLAQSFAGIGFQLQAIRNSIPHDDSTNNDRMLERQVDRAMSMARTSHEEARRSIASLRPESLGHVGLLRALRECAERMVKNGKVTVDAQGDESGRDVPLHIKDTLFRIGQEAIVNSIRHAHARTIRIRVQQQRAAVSLLVEDDGDGFTADSDHAGFGLLGMRKRAETISATLTVRSTPGQGTQVEVRAATGSPFWRFTGARTSGKERAWQL